MTTAIGSRAARIGSFVASTFDVDRRRTFERDAIAIVAGGLALFMWTALASFQPNQIWLYGVSNTATASHNLAGTAGNQLAGFLFFYLGIVSWALPFIVLQFASLARKACVKENIIPTLFGWSSLLFALMPLVVALRPTIAFRGYSFSTGGIIGQMISEWCAYTLGATGSQIVLWTLLFAALVLISRLALVDVWSMLRSHYQSDNENPGIKKDSSSTPAHATSEPIVTGTLDNNAKSSEMSLFEEAPAPSLFDRFGLDPFSKKEDSKDALQKDSTQGTVSLSMDSTDDVDENSLARFEDFAPKVPYAPPSIEIFKKTDERTLVGLSQKELEATSQVLVKTLEDFGVSGKIVGWQPGPVVTVYEYQPDAGVKQAKILSLLDDIALSLKVDSIFIHPVPGKRALGIQVPNSRRDSVLLGDVLSSDVFARSPSPLTFAMGKTINGTPYCADLTAMPHLLAAGATGTGKSVAINSLLCSIIMKSSPDDVRMILVDPKMLELSVYDGIPHLLMPVITEPDRASSALKWAANEMERRYKLMQHAQVRNIGGFNLFWDAAGDEKKTQLRGLMGDESIQRLPYILLVIDELADLMLTAPKDVESSIQRLAQKARASGIHMVLATQRPSVDVITGVIKANLPCRLSFQTVSKHDSRTILDQVGAEKLLGKGDILLQRPGTGKLERLQGTLVSDEEVLSLVATAKANHKAATYDERAMSWIDEEVTKSSAAELSEDVSSLMDSDPKWDEAINIAKTHGVVSASFLQRHLKIGYNRAARIVEGMEAQGLVAKADGAKPRRWLGSVG